MKVWIYPDRTWEEFGSSRFLVSTDVVRPEAMGKTEDIDIDRDIRSVSWGFKTEDEARAQAKDDFV